MAFVKFVECVQPLNAVADALGCVCLHRRAARSGKFERRVVASKGEYNSRTAGSSLQ